MRLSRSLTLVVGSLLLTGIGCSEEAGPGPGVGTGGSVSGSGGSGAGTGGSGAGTGGASASSGGSSTNTGGSTTGTGGGAACPEDWGTTGEEAGITGFENIYHYFDECYSTITTTATEGKICTSGSAAQVVDEMYSEIWGAGVGVQQTADAVFDLSAYTGFKYTIETPPTALRVGVMMDGDDNSYFTETVVAGENTVFFNQLANGEWVDPAGTLDLTKIRDIQWQVPSNGDEAVPFDFCVSGIELITDEAPGTGGSAGTGGGTAAGGSAATGGASAAGGSGGSN